MQKHAALLFTAALIGASSLTARADTTFYLNNVIFANSGEAATGSITIDTSAGDVTAADISYPFTGPSDVFNSLGGQSAGSVYDVQIYDAAGDDLSINLPNASLVGYTGGTFCSGANLCYDSGDGNYDDVTALIDSSNNFADYFNSGSLSLTAPGSASATPEPESLVLLGTGILGALGVARRKRFV